MTQFKNLNNYIGWIVFLIASFVYLSTIEQTVSFWDCGEYIATAYKLQVGHPPGAPLFQLFGRIFTLFATQGTSEVAVAINILSALSSSFTILFLFWTITAFGKKILATATSKEIKGGKSIAILGSGLVGALAYTFSDSFWFSAVEGEVYAMSSLFTAVTFWCIMKWEAEASENGGNRWLILIGYLIGLSVGVHLLSLLTIPAMGMIYYFKKYEYSKLGAAKAFIVSIIILGIVQAGIIPGAISLISTFELFFVNTVGLPFNSGTIIYFFTIIAAITFGLIYTKKHKKAIWNTAILSVMMLLIGYSSFAILVVRSNANPPIDENNPEDAVGLLSYLKREQYGSWPIVYGQHFNALPISYEETSPRYAKGYEISDGKTTKKFFDKVKALDFMAANTNFNFTSIDDKYIEIGKNTKQIYADKDKMFFPRMWSNTQPLHDDGYVNWSGLNWTYEDKNGNRTRDNNEVWKDKRTKRVMTGKKPDSKYNLTYFFRYQIGWSYLRYFMWNFVGRQSDPRNMDGNPLRGNWESGIAFIDNARLGTPSSDVQTPNHLANNKAKNHYFFLPLLLGLIGMLFHFKRSNQDALSVLLFFLFTGVLIIIYLNVQPFQPRERDYAYVGSFYAFSIWIGLGVMSIYEYLNKYLNTKTSAYTATIIALIIPSIMAAENWDDHDRSGRFTALEVAKNYLESCDQNAILFTNGDNDTFPLWYAQEVENIRTDIKVVNLSLFNTDWYIDQMKRASYEAAPIPSSFTHEEYRTGNRDYLEYVKKYQNDVVDIKSVIKYIKTHEKEWIPRGRGRVKSHVFPAKKLRLKVDKEIAKSFVPAEYHNKIVDEIQFQVNNNIIYKNKLMVFDILANFNWERPIYFATTVGHANFMGLHEYFQLEGLAYRLVPYKSSSADGATGTVNTEKMYDRLMNTFKWGGLNNSDLYFDETNTNMVMNFRNNHFRLATALYQKGARDILSQLEETMNKETQLLLLQKGAINPKTKKIREDIFISQPEKLITLINPKKGVIDSNYVDSINLKAIAVLDKCIYEFPENVVRFSATAAYIIDLYYKLSEDEKANKILANMIDDYLIELRYLNAFNKDATNVEGSIELNYQMLALLNSINSENRSVESSVNYIEIDGKYFRVIDDEKTEVNYSTYRINTFNLLDEVGNIAN